MADHVLKTGVLRKLAQTSVMQSLQPRFVRLVSPRPGVVVVTWRKGALASAEQGGKMVTRSRSHSEGFHSPGSDGASSARVESAEAWAHKGARKGIRLRLGVLRAGDVVWCGSGC